MRLAHVRNADALLPAFPICAKSPTLPSAHTIFQDGAARLLQAVATASGLASGGMGGDLGSPGQQLYRGPGAYDETLFEFPHASADYISSIVDVANKADNALGKAGQRLKPKDAKTDGVEEGGDASTLLLRKSPLPNLRQESDKNDTQRSPGSLRPGASFTARGGVRVLTDAAGNEVDVNIPSCMSVLS